MDQQLRQRTVGATVLVLLAVIVVPWVLDGPEEASEEAVGLQLPPPGEDELSVHTIRLDGSEDAADEPSTATADGEPDGGKGGGGDTDPVTEPASSSAGADDAGGEADTAADGTGSVERREPADVAEGTDAGQDPIQAWAVQVYSLTDQDRAEREVIRLREAGFPAFLTRHESAGELFFRVRVGPEQSRDTAERLATRVADSTGTEPTVVRHP